MNRHFSGTGIMVLGIVLVIGGAIGLYAQDARPSPQDSAKLTAEQKGQVERLAQLEDQLQKSREALHAAINEYGWESDQADDAREKLVNDRAEYRKLRRSLVASGMAVPPPSGLGAGGPDGRPSDRGGRGYGGRYGRHHHGHCGCDCGRW
jgi:hypothetical protein